jgi:hypothetical protein
VKLGGIAKTSGRNPPQTRRSNRPSTNDHSTDASRPKAVIRAATKRAAMGDQIVEADIRSYRRG